MNAGIGILPNLSNEIFNILPNYMKEMKDFAGNIYIEQSFAIFLKSKAIKAKDAATKDLQILMKQVNDCTKSLDIKQKHKLDEMPYQNEQIFKTLYKNVKDPKLRAIRYRLLQGDIFCKERMHRFNMSESHECERCGEVETIKHQFYECDSAFNCWRRYNSIIEELGWGDCRIENYEDIVLPNMYGNEVSETLKSLIVKMHLQISRPLIVNRAMILAALKKQANMELVLLRKNAPHKYQKSKWKKVHQFLNNL
jgi:hypothetical protein